MKVEPGEAGHPGQPGQVQVPSQVGLDVIDDQVDPGDVLSPGEPGV